MVRGPTGGQRQATLDVAGRLESLAHRGLQSARNDASNEREGSAQRLDSEMVSEFKPSSGVVVNEPDTKFASDGLNM